MTDEKDKKVEVEEEKTETKAPISEICAQSESLAAEQLEGDDSDVEPVSGFFFTSQRWH